MDRDTPTQKPSLIGFFLAFIVGNLLWAALAPTVVQPYSEAVYGQTMSYLITGGFLVAIYLFLVMMYLIERRDAAGSNPDATS